jgi:DNA-binding FadR family transcriptional regulator
MRAAENELLLKMWEQLHVEIHSRKTVMQPNIDLAGVAESHAPIFAAVAAGDTEAACRLSREHQEYFKRRA